MHPLVQSFMDLFKKRDEAKAKTRRFKIPAISIPEGPIQLPLFRRRRVEARKMQIRHQRLRAARPGFELKRSDPDLGCHATLSGYVVRNLPPAGEVPRGVLQYPYYNVEPSVVHP